MDKGNPVDWLLEPVTQAWNISPGATWLKPVSGKLTAAKKKAHGEEPIARVLAKMKVDGYWEQPGAGYYPKIHRNSMVGHPVSPARSLR